MKLKAGDLQDPGFGLKTTSSARLINPDGTFRVKRSGAAYFDPYMWMIHMPWRKFFALLFVGYVLINVVFALVFFLIGVENLTGVSSGPKWQEFFDAFFFSIQTFTTVGYGYMSPVSPFANWVASLDAFSGLLYTALATGMFFARFAIPGPSIIFSDFAVVCRHKESTALMMRMANLHKNKIIDLDATLVMTWIDVDTKSRRYSGLPLDISKVMMFPLNWTVVHPISADSPLEGKTKTDLEQMRAEFILLVKGYDETYAQMVSASRSFLCNEVQWNRRFSLMYDNGEDEIVLHLDKINDIEPDG